MAKNNDPVMIGDGTMAGYAILGWMEHRRNTQE